MKKIVIIKNSRTQLKLEKDYFIISSSTYDSVVSYRHIKSLYINKLIPITIAEGIKLAKMFDLYFTDQHGNILGKMQIYEKV